MMLKSILIRYNISNISIQLDIFEVELYQLILIKINLLKRITKYAYLGRGLKRN